MPELPEVEVTRRSVAPHLLGARIVAVRLGKPLRWPLGVPPEALQGRTIVGLRRRGKYLLVDFAEGGMLLIHLGMSGRLAFARADMDAGPHDHVDLVLDRGLLRLHDPRRFGAVVYCASADDAAARKLLGRLGPEPLDEAFDFDRFYQALRGRSAAIKQVLLTGDVVAGIGNIYASEALFEAGIRPTTLARRLSRVRAQRLHSAIRRVLAQALACGGSTLRDFRAADGRAGYFQREAAVYGRAAEPCRRCGSAIRSVVIGQRSTFYCPRCQT